jgi:hypothetical protein
MKLLGKEPPFSCEETWNDEAFVMGMRSICKERRNLLYPIPFMRRKAFVSMKPFIW